MSKKKVGFFGGTFDPIHFGHLNLALQIKEKKDLDEVIFSPAFISPFKLNASPTTSDKDRLKMLKLALVDLPYFSISDFELKSGRVSYTIDIIKIFKKDMKDSDLFLILSEETLGSLSEWKEVTELLTIAPPLIGVSEHFKGEVVTSLSSLIHKENFIAINWLQISSTEIRDRLKRKLFCEHLIPKKVLDYIYQNNLY